MHAKTRETKKNRYLDAAEGVFGKYGFQNAKMEWIAEAGGCSKPTLYAYFESKENLYMAVTLRAFEGLVKAMESAVEAHADRPGLDAAIELFWTYQRFSEEHAFYHQLLLEYLNFIRSVSNDSEHAWLTESMRRSPYFEQVKAIQNAPLAICVAQIQRGQADGSIENDRDPIEMYLTAWAFIIGFTKINSIASGKMYNYPIEVWKTHVYQQVRQYLRFGVLGADQ